MEALSNLYLEAVTSQLECLMSQSMLLCSQKFPREILFNHQRYTVIMRGFFGFGFFEFTIQICYPQGLQLNPHF